MIQNIIKRLYFCFAFDESSYKCLIHYNGTESTTKSVLLYFNCMLYVRSVRLNVNWNANGTEIRRSVKYHGNIRATACTRIDDIVLTVVARYAGNSRCNCRYGVYSGDGLIRSLAWQLAFRLKHPRAV